MGQILNSIDSRLAPDVLRTSALPQCGVLTGCSTYAGTLLEIRRLYERYRRHSAASGHYVTPSVFRSITRNSPLEGFLDACRGFERGPERSLNVLELLCALVLFSSSAWEDKATYLLRLYDFDGNKCLSHDELTILCSQVVNGFASITGCPRLLSTQLSRLSDQVFGEADSDPDGLVTYDECELYRIKRWIRLTPDLYEFLSNSSGTVTAASQPELLFLYMHEAAQSDKTPLRTLRKNGSGDFRSPKHSLGGNAPVSRRPPQHMRSNSDVPKPSAISIRGALVTKEQVIGIKQVFNLICKGHAFDEIKSGILSAADLKRVAQEMTVKSMTFDELLVRMFKGATQRDLKVLTQWVADWEQSQPKKVEEAVIKTVSFNSLAQYQSLFDAYDTNKNGELSLFELKQALSHMFSNRDIEQMFEQYDENHDDKISLMEFMRMMAPEGKEVVPEIAGR